MTKDRNHDQPPQVQEIHVEKLKAIVDHARALGLSEEEHSTLAGAIDTLGFLSQVIESKDGSIAKLRLYLFGATTESSRNVLGHGDAASTSSSATKKPKPPVKGHGRHAAADYTGADKCFVPHETLKAKETCPLCGKGKVYPLASPSSLVRITGMAPLSATVYELEQLRCNLCGEVFTAKEPATAGSEKYDEGAVAMIALLKYGAGMPFNRIQDLQKGLGIPLPATTQWELVADNAPSLLPVHKELVRQAAQGEVVHSDDTTMKILELTGERRRKAIAAGDIDPNQRVGLFTSGIVSLGAAVDGGSNGSRTPEIVLFFTGSQHAGENLADVLKQRLPSLAPPIHMCDALSSNTAGDFEAVLARCVSHARRAFVEIFDNFPDECRRVIEDLREVYRTDGRAEQEKLTPEQRLALHQEESTPRMDALRAEMQKQLEKRLVEPNSGLGKAYAYMLKHWDGLTLFLRQAGAPIDNNTCERALKKAVLNRKNAYFYKTRVGAEVGDMYMSLIHTAERCGTSPFDYLRTLLRNAKIVASNPAAWMPWSYAATLAALTGSSTPGP